MWIYINVEEFKCISLDICYPHYVSHVRGILHFMRFRVDLMGIYDSDHYLSVKTEFFSKV